MKITNKRFNKVWNQKKIPVIYRFSRTERPIIRLPHFQNYPSDSMYFKDWLKDKHWAYPIWLSDDKCWQIPSIWLEDVIKRMLKKYEQVYIIHTYRSGQKCAPACWGALGPLCGCSCGGKNHGRGQRSGAWHIVSDTYAFEEGNTQYSSRLILPV